MPAKKKSKNDKTADQKTGTEQPPVIFSDGRATKPVSLIVLGVIAVVMGFLSKTTIMARTILSTPADFMVIFGIMGIIAGLILNYRNKRSSNLVDKKKSK